MIIGIDINSLFANKRETYDYTRNLIKNVLKLDRKNHYFLYASFIGRPSQKRFLEIFVTETKAKNVTLKILPIPARVKEILTTLPISLRNIIKEDLDLYFLPHFVGLPAKGFEDNIVTFTDLAARSHARQIKKALENVEQIITVSKSIKKNLIEELEIDQNKIEVVYPGTGPEFRVLKNSQQTSEILKKYFPAKKKFILSFGSIKPANNLQLLISAFANFPNRLKYEYELVLVLSDKKSHRVLREIINNYNLGEKVVFVENVADEDLPYFYSQASIFVDPSTNEGFGLAVLESMACGTPVICAKIPPLIELVGTAAILIDPRSEESLTSAIEKVLADKKTAKKLTQNGLIQARKFTWKIAAKKTLEVLNQFPNGQKNTIKKIR